MGKLSTSMGHGFHGYPQLPEDNMRYLIIPAEQFLKHLERIQDPQILKPWWLKLGLWERSSVGNSKSKEHQTLQCGAP